MFGALYVNVTRFSEESCMVAALELAAPTPTRIVIYEQYTSSKLHRESKVELPVGAWVVTATLTPYVETATRTPVMPPMTPYHIFLDTDTPTCTITPINYEAEEHMCMEIGHMWGSIKFSPILSENAGEIWWGFEENVRRGRSRHNTGRSPVVRCRRCGLWREVQ